MWTKTSFLSCIFCSLRTRTVKYCLKNALTSVKEAWKLLPKTFNCLLVFLRILTGLFSVSFTIHFSVLWTFLLQHVMINRTLLHLHESFTFIIKYFFKNIARFFFYTRSTVQNSHCCVKRRKAANCNNWEAEAREYFNSFA